MTDCILMTYKEIAAAMNLSGPTSARMKVKRKGWTVIPGNHPSAAVKVEVPRNALPDSSTGSRAERLSITAPVNVTTLEVITELRAQVVMLASQAERDRATVNTIRAERDAREIDLRAALERAAKAEGELVGIRRGWLGRWLR